MRKYKVSISFLLAITMLICSVLPTLAAENVYKKVDYYETDNWSLWGDVDEDGMLYVIMSYDNGDMYISKINMKTDDMVVREAKFEKEQYLSTVRDVMAEKDSYTYWENMKKVAIEQDEQFKVVVNAQVVENNSRATTAENLTLNYMKSREGNEYYNYLRKTDTTSYPGTTIKVYEKKTLGVQQSSTVAVQATAILSSVVALVCKVAKFNKTAVVSELLADACDLILDVNGVFTSNGTIIPVYGSAVTKRYCTINSGNVVYSEASKQVIYDGVYCSTTGGFECDDEATKYNPSEYCYGTSNGYLWLINTAYNNYS